MVTVKRKCFVVPCKTYGKSWIYKFLPEDTLHTGDNVECNDDELRDNIHVHILTNDYIEDGDYFMNKYFEEVFQCSGKEHEQTLKHTSEYSWVKIVASTDESLGLPFPSKSFMDKYITSYNNRNTIEEVMVDFEAKFTASGTEFTKVKNNSKNNIIISKVKNDFSILDIKNALHQVELDDNKDYTKIWNKLKEKLEIM